MLGDRLVQLRRQPDTAARRDAFGERIGQHLAVHGCRRVGFVGIDRLEHCLRKLSHQDLLEPERRQVCPLGIATCVADLGGQLASVDRR